MPKLEINAPQRWLIAQPGNVASEICIAEAPDHMIHSNGERFLGPYPDVMPAKS